MTSSRLQLRAVEPTDVDLMYEVENDTDAWRYSDTVSPLSIQLLTDYALSYDADPFSAGQLRLIITEKTSDKPVGIADLYSISQRHRHAFIGIYILKEFRELGYAKETINILENYAKDILFLHQLGAKVEEGNKKALSLFLSCGYEEKVILDQWLAIPGGKFTGLILLTKKLYS